jgi:hypothetical protein
VFIISLNTHYWALETHTPVDSVESHLYLLVKTRYIMQFSVFILSDLPKDLKLESMISEAF